MNKTIHVLQSELAKVRTGRASTSLVSDIIVDYYGAQTPINQLANISTPDTTSIIIQPWDETVINEIEKAINKSDLGITPANDGKIIRLTIPPLTEERRKELVKYVSKISEDHKVAIRQIRKDTNNHIKELEKTDKMIDSINIIFEKKQKEVLEI